MATTTPKNKKDELWKWSFILLAEQQEKEWLWRDFASDQFAEVIGRLNMYYTHKILDSDDSVSYPVEFNKKVLAHVGETIGAGFYLYCADVVHIKHEFESYFEVKPYNDPGLKDFLMAEVEKLIDNQEVDDKYEPPKYAFETIKEWAKFWIVKIIPNDTTFQELESETQKEVYLTQIAWLITLGYIVTSLQKTYHDSKVKKPTRRLVQ